MIGTSQDVDILGLVEDLTYKEKVDRSLSLIEAAHREYGSYPTRSQ